MFFSVWLISHSIMPSRFIHVVTKSGIPFILITENIPLCRHMCVCVLSPFSQVHCPGNTGVGCLCPPPGDLPNPGTEPVSLMSLALPGGFFTTSATWEVHIYTHLFHPFIIDSYLGCLLILAIVNNTEVQISHWCPIFLSSGYISRSGLAGSYGCSSFSFLRNLYTAFCNGSTNLHFHQKCRVE